MRAVYNHTKPAAPVRGFFLYAGRVMPIVVVCPGCGAKLNAPDIAAGKRVKCPKPECGTAITIPAPAAEFEVVEDEPPAPPKKPAPAPVAKPKKPVVEVDEDEDEDAPKKPAKKPARAVEEDDEKPKKKAKARAVEDDEDDEDDRPTKKKKKQKGGLSPALIGAIAVGGVLLLGGVGYGIYALAFQKKEETAKPNPTPNPNPQPPGPVGPNPPGVTPGIPAGWEEYRSDGDKFKMMMPKGVMKEREKESNGYMGMDKSGPRLVVVTVQDLPKGATAQQRAMIEEEILKEFTMNPEAKILKRERVQFAGLPTVQLVLEEKDAPDQMGGTFLAHGVARVMMTDTRAYMLFITGKYGPEVLNETKTISDSFQVLK